MDAAIGRECRNLRPPDREPQAAVASVLEELATQFVDYLASYRRSSHHTVSAYRRDLARLERFLGARNLPTEANAISTRHVQAFAVSLSGLAPASVNRALNACSSFFGWLGRQGLVEGNPVADVERPKVPLKLPNGPSLGDAQKLVEAARNTREKSMVLLLSCCGLRRSELLNLDTGDLSSVLSELRVRQGKGQKGRVIPIPAQCRAVLREYLATQGSRTGPLFAKGRGTRLGATGFYR